MGKLNKILIIATCLAVGAPALAGDIASAKSNGYRGKDIKKYDKMVKQYTKKSCSDVKTINTKAQKVAGKKAKGTGTQIAAGVLNQNGTSGAGLLASVTGNVVKDSAIRRDASHAVLKAKACK